MQSEQTRREAGEPAAQRGSEQEDAVRVDAHQRHDGPVLGDRPDRGAEVGALEKQIHADHGGQGDQECDEAREAQVQLAHLQRWQDDAEALELDAKGQRGRALEQEQHAAGHEQLVDRLSAQHRADHELVQRGAQHGDQGDASREGEPQWP